MNPLTPPSLFVKAYDQCPHVAFTRGEQDTVYAASASAMPRGVSAGRRAGDLAPAVPDPWAGDAGFGGGGGSSRSLEAGGRPPRAGAGGFPDELEQLAQAYDRCGVFLGAKAEGGASVCMCCMCACVHVLHVCMCVCACICICEEGVNKREAYCG